MGVVSFHKLKVVYSSVGKHCISVCILYYIYMYSLHHVYDDYMYSSQIM